MTFFHREKCNYAAIMYASVKNIIPIPAYALKLQLISKFAQLAGFYICQLLWSVLKIFLYVCKWRGVLAFVLCIFMMYPPYCLFSEHVCSIMASMLRNLKSQQRTRLHNKFTENDCEKVSLCCILSSFLHFLLLLFFFAHQHYSWIWELSQTGI